MGRRRKGDAERHQHPAPAVLLTYRSRLLVTARLFESQRILLSVSWQPRAHRAELRHRMWLRRSPRQEQSRIRTQAVGPQGLCFAHCPLSLRTTCPPGEAVAAVRPLCLCPLAFPAAPVSCPVPPPHSPSRKGHLAVVLRLKLQSENASSIGLQLRGERGYRDLWGAGLPKRCLRRGVRGALRTLALCSPSSVWLTGNPNPQAAPGPVLGVGQGSRTN